MAPVKQLFVCLIASVVGMVTAAPVANDENLINDANNVEIDRAKRAQELVYFGNQQNPARPPAKKSDPSLMVELQKPVVPINGEIDEGGVVVPHEAKPITADLEARVEAAGPDDKQKAKVADAMESAMYGPLSASLNEPEAKATDDSNQDTESTDETADTEEAVEDNSEDVRNEVENSDSGSDEVEKQLQEATASEDKDGADSDTEASASEKSSSESSSDETVESPPEDDNAEEDQEVQDFLDQLRKQDNSESNVAPPSGLDPNFNNYYKNIYQYMMSNNYPQDQEVSRYPYLPIYYRRRRSSPQLRRNRPLALTNNRRTRRIKRDLLDELAYPFRKSSDNYLADSDDYVPLTDEDVEYLYSKMLPYLAEAYAEEVNDEPNPYDSRELDSIRPSYPLLGEYEPEEDQLYGLDVPVYAERPYEDVEPRYSFDNENSYQKRDMMDYYPSSPRKRYFYPFADEPETHWGAFVPQKRNYDEAIHRLQRLAMALSDNPGPYYTDVLREYKKK